MSIFTSSLVLWALIYTFGESATVGEVAVAKKQAEQWAREEQDA